MTRIAFVAATTDFSARQTSRQPKTTATVPNFAKQKPKKIEIPTQQYTKTMSEPKKDLINPPSSAVQSAPSKSDKADHSEQVTLSTLSTDQLVTLKSSMQAGLAHLIDAVKTQGAKFGAAGALIASAAESLVALIDPPGTTTEECRVISGFNLSARATARVVAQIEDPKLKKDVARVVGPLLNIGMKDTTNKDVTELFDCSSINDLEEDLVSNAAKSEINEKSSAERHERFAYFCKGAVIRRNGKFTLFIAYFVRTITLPLWSIAALLESHKDIDRYVKTMKLLAQHELHQAMLREAPPGVLLHATMPQAAITNAIM
jgi:hypothetical protein